MLSWNSCKVTSKMERHPTPEYIDHASVNTHPDVDRPACNRKSSTLKSLANMMNYAMKINSYIVCGIFGLGLIFLYSLEMTDTDVRKARHPPALKNYIQIVSSDNFVERYKAIQKARIGRIQAVCAKPSALLTSKYNGQNRTSYYYSPTYNFTFCKVAKSGSTFWTQAFELLEGGISNADVIFNRKRASVHTHSGRFSRNVSSALQQRVPAVLVSRDPYSRLFSAYIDKFYVPLMFKDLKNIVRNEAGNRKNGCPSRNISFQDFLTTVSRKAFDGNTLNGHWAPIVSLCRPCDITPSVLVKQETFSIDVEYALRIFHIEQEKVHILLESLYGKRTENTVPGIVETVYGYVKNNGALKCMGYYGIAARIWHSFQIQGFLKSTVPFPSNISVNDLKTASGLSDKIMNAIASNPMSREDQTAQRRAALIRAYGNVNANTLNKIKQVYKSDFALFDYDDEPPLS